MKPIKFQLRSFEYRSNPWRVFTEFRERGPVIRAKMPLIGNGWAATSYESTSQVFRDDELFVRDPKNAGRRTFGFIQWFIPRSMMTLTNSMIAKDGQSHRRLRSLVDQAFARRNIDGMNERLEFLANEQLDAAEAIARREGQVDLVEHFARPFPMNVICELLGIPMKDRSKLRKWLAPFSNFKGFFDIIRIYGGIKKLMGYLREQFAFARMSPGKGLISELVMGPNEEERLNDEELLSMVFLLFVAGHETTVHLITNCLLSLAEHPTEKQKLVEDWTKFDGAIEEVLRYNSPIQIGKPRYVTTDVEFFGQSLKRGEIITPMIACANYDPDRFENPLDFNIERDRNYHLSFGSGPHTCLGIKLARAETLHALKTLYSRWPNLELTFSLDAVDWAQRPGMRGIQSFLVKPNC